MSMLKKVFGFLVMMSFINMLAFPKAPSSYPDTIESMDRVEMKVTREE